MQHERSQARAHKNRQQCQLCAGEQTAHDASITYAAIVHDGEKSDDDGKNAGPHHR